MASLMNRAAAMSALLELATSSRTSTSRPVRASSAGPRMRLTSLVATVGASTVSPWRRPGWSGSSRSRGVSLSR